MTGDPLDAGDRDSRLLQVLHALEDRPVSELTCHDARCCRRVGAWLRAMARATIVDRGSEPRFLKERWAWGPVSWPLSRCEAITRRSLDCGALAHLAAEAFAAAGRQVIRIQLVEVASRKQSEQWQARWQVVHGHQRWIWEDLVYHEAVAVVESSSLRLWDPTDGGWQVAPPAPASRDILAIRARSRGTGPSVRSLHWGALHVPLDQWMITGA